LRRSLRGLGLRMGRAAAPVIGLGLLLLCGCGGRVLRSGLNVAPSVDSGSENGGSESDGGGDGGPCEAAGGQCLPSGDICAVRGSPGCPADGYRPGFFCCLSQVESCGQPSVISFSGSCDAGTWTMPSCTGTPPPPPPFAAGWYVDASFESGCTVTFPYCNAGTPIECTCEGVEWNCFR